MPRRKPACRRALDASRHSGGSSTRISGRAGEHAAPSEQPVRYFAPRRKEDVSQPRRTAVTRLSAAATLSASRDASAAERPATACHAASSSLPSVAEALADAVSPAEGLRRGRRARWRRPARWMRHPAASAATRKRWKGVVAALNRSPACTAPGRRWRLLAAARSQSHASCSVRRPAACRSRTTPGREYQRHRAAGRRADAAGAAAKGRRAMAGRRRGLRPRATSASCAHKRRVRRRISRRRGAAICGSKETCAAGPRAGDDGNADARSSPVCARCARRTSPFDGGGEGPLSPLLRRRAARDDASTASSPRRSPSATPTRGRGGCCRRFSPRRHARG